MKLNAAMDPLLALAIGIGWLIIKAIQSRRKDADSWNDLEKPAPPPHSPHRNIGTPPPVMEKRGRGSLPPLAPRPIISSRQRMNRPSLPRQTAALPAPPVIRTSLEPRPILVGPAEGPTGVELAKLKESTQSYARASQLQESIAQRLSDVEKQTETAKPLAPKPRARSGAAAHFLRTMRNPATIRQAFLASFVLNPPKALE